MKPCEAKFKFPLFLRTLTIILAGLAFAWAIYYIFFALSASNRWFQKLAPFIVILLSARVLYKNLFTTNSILFCEKFLQLNYVLRGSNKVFYDKIKKLEFRLKPRKVIVLTYLEEREQKQLKIPRGITDIIAAINLIVKKAPQVELDEFLSSVVTRKYDSQEV